MDDRVEEVFRCRSCGATILVKAERYEVWPDSLMNAARERHWLIRSSDPIWTGLCPACST